MIPDLLVEAERRSRLRIVAVSFDAMTKLLSGRVEAVEGLPADAEVVGVHQISLFQMIELQVCSAEFAPLTAGMMIPRQSSLLLSVRAKEPYHAPECRCEKCSR